MKADFIA